MTLLGQRVFVTGASGFIGRHLVPTLVARGAEVHALARGLSAFGPASDYAKATSDKEAGRHGSRVLAHDRLAITTYVGDLMDEATLRAALAAASPAIVFHLAAYGARPGENDRQRMFDVNVTGSINLWNALPDSVTRVVMAGTCREYAPATSAVSESYPSVPMRPYPATKHAAATLLAAMASQDNRSFVSLRLFGPYGPDDDTNRVIPYTIRLLLAGEPVPLSDGQQLVDFAYVDDQVAALVSAATSTLPAPVATYNIGGGTPLRLRSVLEAIGDAIGGTARSRLRFGALPRRPGDTEALCADITAARRDLGYEPTVTLNEGLQRTVEWHMAASVANPAGSRGEP